MDNPVTRTEELAAAKELATRALTVRAEKAGVVVADAFAHEFIDALWSQGWRPWPELVKPSKAPHTSAPTEDWFEVRERLRRGGDCG